MQELLRMLEVWWDKTTLQDLLVEHSLLSIQQVQLLQQVLREKMEQREAQEVVLRLRRQALAVLVVRQETVVQGAQHMRAGLPE